MRKKSLSVIEKLRQAKKMKDEGRTVDIHKLEERISKTEEAQLDSFIHEPVFRCYVCKRTSFRNATIKVIAPKVGLAICSECDDSKLKNNKVEEKTYGNDKDKIELGDSRTKVRRGGIHRRTMHKKHR